MSRQPATRIADAAAETAPPSRPPPIPLPTTIGSYQLLRQFGNGGMGTVYLAEHKRLQRPVALTVLKPELVSGPLTHARFEREMLAVGRVRSTRVVQPFDAGEHHGVPFLAMESIDGFDLSKIALWYESEHRTSLLVSTVCGILGEVAGAVAEVHQAGFVHRDHRSSDPGRQPQNFTPFPGTVALYDFAAGSGGSLRDVSGHGHDGRIVWVRWFDPPVSTTAAVASAEAESVP